MYILLNKLKAQPQILVCDNIFDIFHNSTDEYFVQNMQVLLRFISTFKLYMVQRIRINQHTF